MILREYFPGETLGQIRARLRGGAVPMAFTQRSGAGRMDLLASVQWNAPPPAYSATLSGYWSVEPYATCRWDVSTTVPNPTSYEWSVDYSTVGGNSPTLYYANTGASFTLQVMVRNDAGDAAAGIRSVDVFTGAGQCNEF